MIKSFYYNHQDMTVEQDLPLEGIKERLSHEKDMLWIDIYDMGENELFAVAEQFGFHPLAVEDCLHVSSRPKVDQYEGYFFFVIHALRYNEESEEEITPVELNIFYGPNYLVTVHKSKMAPIRRLADACVKSRVYLDKGPDYLLYSIVDGITDEYFPIMDRLSIRIDELEDGMFEKRLEEITDEFLALKRTLVMIRRIIIPQRRIFTSSNGIYLFDVQQENIPYYLDLADHLERLVDSTETFRDLVNGALDTYSSYVNAQAIDVMRLLTIISTIILPLTFITGIFGMNVPIPASEFGWTIWAIIGFMFLLAGLMIFYFRRRNWL